ncbi:natural cytotoxicity triggering receptor 2 [Phodopus roborovskii]|nr:natural cytotoxicity triggering receptor 2 [Phodopus roborovskii]
MVSSWDFSAFLTPVLRGRRLQLLREPLSGSVQEPRHKACGWRIHGATQALLTFSLVHGGLCSLSSSSHTGCGGCLGPALPWSPPHGIPAPFPAPLPSSRRGPMAWEASCLLSPILLVLLASGSWAQGTESLQRVEGTRLSVKCWYDPSQHLKEKIWCVKTPADTCNILVSSPAGRDAQGGRSFIWDNPDSNSFTVIVTALRTTDSGSYHCGTLESRRMFTVLRSFSLVVSKDNSNTPASGMTSTWTVTEVPTFNPTEDLNAISARVSTSSIVVPVVCGLFSKTLVFTVLFAVTQKCVSFG